MSTFEKKNENVQVKWVEDLRGLLVAREQKSLKDLRKHLSIVDIDLHL